MIEEAAILYTVVRESLPETMAFEQSSEGNTGASTCPSRGTLSQAQEFVSAKILKLTYVWIV